MSLTWTFCEDLRLLPSTKNRNSLLFYNQTAPLCSVATGCRKKVHLPQLQRTNRLLRHKMKTLKRRKPTIKITHMEKAWGEESLQRALTEQDLWWEVCPIGFLETSTKSKGWKMWKLWYSYSKSWVNQGTRSRAVLGKFFLENWEGLLNQNTQHVGCGSRALQRLLVA